MDVKRIIKEYWEQFSAHKFDNIDEMDQLLERQSVPNLTKEETDDVNKWISLYLLTVATHSSTLAWKIPWTEGPGRLQSMGSLGVGHDWGASLSLFTFMHWRRKWQPTPVFLPGESQGRGAWWAAVYGVAQSQIQLKWLSSSSISINRLVPNRKRSTSRLYIVTLLV